MTFDFRRNWITVAVSGELLAELSAFLEEYPESRSDFLRRAIRRTMEEDRLKEKRNLNSLLFLHIAVDYLLIQAGPEVRDRVHEVHRIMMGKRPMHLRGAAAILSDMLGSLGAEGDGQGTSPGSKSG